MNRIRDTMYKVAGYVFWYTLLVVSNTVRSSDDITEQNLAALLYTFASTEYPSPTVDLLDRQLPCHCSENHNSAFVVLLTPFNGDTQPEEESLEEQSAQYGGKVKRWQCADCLAHFATWKTLVTHQTALEGRNKCPRKDQEEPEESSTHLDQQPNLKLHTGKKPHPV